MWLLVRKGEFMTPMRLTALLLSSCLFAAAPSWASTARKAACSSSTYAYFNLSVSPAQLSGSCQWVLGTDPVLLTISVELYSAPASKVRFSLPDPPFGTLSGEVWNFPATGDRHTGMELALGCTAGGPVVLGTLTVLLVGETVSCATWKVNDGVEAEDCYGNLQPAVAPTFTFDSVGDPYTCDTCFQYCEGLPPYGLHPDQGATGVPVDAPLSFDYPVYDYVDPSDECWIQIGTDPSCGDAQVIVVPCDTRSVVLDFLEHSTTYYWQAGWAVLYGSGCSNETGNRSLSPVHSFTTAGPIAAEKATWGHVKAMYRD